MKDILTNFSIKNPKSTVSLVVFTVILFGMQFPKVKFDNDPENMLSPKEEIRIFHNEVKKRYNLYDFVVVGVVNESNEQGVFNVGTLNRIHQLTNQLISLHKNTDGLPEVTKNGKPFVPHLVPDSAWKRFLNTIFSHAPTQLFNKNGESVIIAHEIISPSVVDNIKQADLGSLKVEYLMENAPKNQSKADEIRDNAMSNPLYKNTLFSGDGKAAALYIPITEKHFSYNVANLVKELTKNWPKEDQVHITGLPVAEDTFGVEMLVQMATSAPFAGLIIFILLLLFFRQIQLIIAPMLVAITSVVCAMGMLIGLGYDVHIMSSMIAIFLMPIAVTDSVHMLSEFFDTYNQFHDKAKTVKHVVHHLFMPMLYTSLTTIAGFASLATTPIPPVQVFGLHVAFGVALAWVLTITFVPAYIMLFVSEKSMQHRHQKNVKKQQSSMLVSVLEKTGRITYVKWKLILISSLIIIITSGYGITLIEINDNPVKWFDTGHTIRIADRVMNHHFGGTYTAYLTLFSDTVHKKTCREKLEIFKQAVSDKYKDKAELKNKLMTKFSELEQLFSSSISCDPEQCFAALATYADQLDKKEISPWLIIGDEINYLDPDGLSFAEISEKVSGMRGITETVKQQFMQKLSKQQELTGEKLQNRALEICTEREKDSVKEFLFATKTEMESPLFKKPEVLHYIKTMQQHFRQHDIVGKTSSCVDALEKANYELNFIKGMDDRNKTFYSIPKTVAATGQVFIQLEGTKKKDSLFHLVTKDYQQANIWFQLKSGDNKDMETVVQAVKQYMKQNPPPVNLTAKWAGLTYLNVVWQEKMVSGMLSSLGTSFIVVFVMMMVLFRSPLLGLLSMIPLSVTITFIYGMIGFAGKDYDMPVAVLSSLTLGLSVDFAIHFLERTRETAKQCGNWKNAAGKMFGEPAMAITRNAIVIAIGFTPLLLAPLVPYKTVGLFLALIMSVSGIGTLLILPALVTMLQKVLFKNKSKENEK